MVTLTVSARVDDDIVDTTELVKTLAFVEVRRLEGKGLQIGAETATLAGNFLSLSQQLAAQSSLAMVRVHPKQVDEHPGVADVGF